MKKYLVILLCLALACTAFGAAAEAPAEMPEEALPFATVRDAENQTSQEYWSENYYVVLTCRDGVWWHVEAKIDDRYREIYRALLYGGEDGMSYSEAKEVILDLPVASAEVIADQPETAETLKGYTGKTVKDLLADGFGFDYIQAATGDETKNDWNAERFILTDDSGTEYRVPLYLYASDWRGFIFAMVKGHYSYMISFREGTEESLREAAENGTWVDLVIAAAEFNGFSSEVSRNLGGIGYHSPIITEEEALALKTVEETMNYDCVIYTPENGKEYCILLNGEDCFWLASAALDERYHELDRAADNPATEEESAEAYNARWNYLKALPVTVEKLGAGHPQRIEDLSAYTGKRVRDLYAEGFRTTFFSATTEDESQETYSAELTLKDADGLEYTIYGSRFYTEFDEWILLEMVRGLYQYEFRFDGNAEALDAAVRDGAFEDLEVREGAYIGLSPEAIDLIPRR